MIKGFLNLLLRLTEVAFALEFIAIPFGLWLNHRHTEIIQLKTYLGYDAILMIATVTFGIIISQILKQIK